MSTVKKAVVYDCDVERANEVAAVLRFLDIEAMLVDHAALMRSLLQGNDPAQALLIGDISAVSDSPDWLELGAALRTRLHSVTVVSYGSAAVMEQLTAASGAGRVLRVPFPFKYGSLATALAPAANASIESVSPVRVPTGTSLAVREVITLIRQVAGHDSSVLILGESGTGKEVVAHAIHEASPRRQRPFVAINCGAIPAELLESELFGHEKGSFTGAVTARKGRFEIAEGGTLFLDEIGDMSLPMQVKLLRVLQERAFDRVGGNTPIRCNVRIIAATHRNLEESIQRGTFREDLFYRLNVFPIEMPSLRARIDDLPLLVRDFARQNSAQGRGRIEFSAPAFGALMHYAWPGNVRELGNLVERMSILHPSKLVCVADLPHKYRPTGWTPSPEPAASPIVRGSEAAPVNAAVYEGNNLAVDDTSDEQLAEEAALRLLTASDAALNLAELSNLPSEGIDLRTHLYTIERTLIRQALARSDGTVAQAARLLNLRRTTLVEKLRKFDLLADDATSHVTDSEASALVSGSTIPCGQDSEASEV
ncbi:MAG: sigma-54-dependent Fis family transcriptional regulator [Candidatus Obscuribacterales bacterium]|nr:sigma-54-dependent Fis family transcriptional regulator [Steroidobacteraceae bacterium]